MTELECIYCKGEGWVCNEHRDKAWNCGNGHWAAETRIVGGHPFDVRRICIAGGKLCVCQWAKAPWHYSDRLQILTASGPVMLEKWERH